ncbi:MAG: carboxypeptidase-like regulatory domain-containing protein [Bacteroidota bacterium]|nr:carboxypeptidase-like regulatory domain-containing protein [Bacteroidota bacterium]
MKKLFVFAMMVLSFMNLSAQDLIKLSGRVTDFNSMPLDSVSVQLKNDKFATLYETLSDKDGYYSMNVSKGQYFCLIAIKLSDYGRTKLEYWTWNIPLYKDLNINPQYERMEIYGLNVFEPKVAPYDTYMIYFRPMSLTKALKLRPKENNKNFEQKATTNHDTIDYAPKNITPEEINIQMNGRESNVLTINKLVEYGRGGYMYGYLVQFLKPKVETSTLEKYDKISITLHSKETNETGKGEVFVQKKE